MSYSIDFRRKVLTIRDREGLSMEQAAQRFGISKQTVYNWTKQLIPCKTRNKPATKINMQALAEDVRRYPDAYQFERAKRLNVSVRGIGYALKRLGITYKKKASRIPRHAQKNGIFFRIKYLSMNIPVNQLFILMKAVLLMILHVPMVIL